MIELPESLVIADQLEHTVLGKRITEAEAGHTKHSFAWYEGDPTEYAGKMEGSIFRSARGIGAMVDLDLGDYRFIAGDGTNLRYFEPGKKLPERYQTRITFEDDSSLICTVQMYGAMNLIRPDEYDNFYYLTALKKPQPGTNEFDYEYFTSLRNEVSGNLSIKAFLATEQRVPGLGNGVLQDILLEAGLHPKKKISSLREADWKHTYESVLKILNEMRKAGGRDTEKTLFGEPGGYQTKLRKKTVGKPCPYCGSTIQKMSYLGGTVYFCPQCQTS